MTQSRRPDLSMGESGVVPRGSNLAPGPPSLDDVLESAARLQQVVPGAVLVGGSAAAHHARHRLSLDHDHVLSDLKSRFDTVLDNLEAMGDWSTARVGHGKIILGSLGDIETGVRQMIRERPLETERVEVRGRSLVVPTEPETLRIKAWLAVQRNQTRDYLDIAALADHMGIPKAAAVLDEIDEFYADRVGSGSIVTQLVRQLADPRPRDAAVITQLSTYKQLDSRWHDWKAVRTVLTDLAQQVVTP